MSANTAIVVDPALRREIEERTRAVRNLAAQPRYRELTTRLEDEVLTRDEQVELIALSDQIEEANADRLAVVAKAASDCGLTMKALLDVLGLSGPSRE